MTEPTILDWCWCGIEGCPGCHAYAAHRAAISSHKPSRRDVTDDQVLQSQVRTATAFYRKQGSVYPLNDALIEIFDITPGDPRTYVGKAARR